MTGNIIGPNYYIRLLTRRMGEISLNNVLQFTTDFKTSDVGNFTIVLNYEDGWNERNVFQNLTPEKEELTTTDLLNRTTREMVLDIEPYDYVEIYIDRGESTSSSTETEIRNVNNQLVDKYGNPLINPDTGTPYGFGRFLYNEDKTFQFVPFGYTLLPDGTPIKDENNYKAIPLSIEERINNPYLVCCGLVKRVIDSFSIEGGRPNNTITIQGAGLGVFLQDTQLYYGGVYSVYAETLAKIESIYLALSSPSEIVNAVLTNLVKRNMNLLTTNSVIPEEIDENFKKIVNAPLVIDSQNFRKTSFLGDPITDTDPALATEDTTIKDTQITLYNTIPTIDLLYWAINIDAEDTQKYTGGKEEAMRNGRAYWGRLEKTQTGYSRGVVNPQPMTVVLDVLKQNAPMPFNEFFIDELGNIVLRDYLKAVHQGRPTTIDTTGKAVNLYEEFGYDTIIDPIDGSKSKTYVWTDIKSNDIISWNLTKSDDSLKTIVLNQAVLSVVGQVAAFGEFTRAPILTESLDKLMKKIKEGTANKDDEKLAFVYQSFITLANAQVQQVNGYSLTTLDNNGLMDFWRRYGFRVAQLIDVNSFLPDESLINAQSAFLYFLFNMWGGQITIVGNPKIKIGTIVKIVDLKATFYVTGVTHNFVFGHDYTTTLQLTAGRIEGTLNDPYQEFERVRAEVTAKAEEIITIRKYESPKVSQTLKGVTFGAESKNLTVVTPGNGSFTTINTSDMEKQIIWEGSFGGLDMKITYGHLTVNPSITTGTNYPHKTPIGVVTSGLFYKIEAIDTVTGKYRELPVQDFVLNNSIEFLNTDSSNFTYTPNDRDPKPGPAGTTTTGPYTGPQGLKGWG